MSISYSTLPNFSELFITYINNFPALKNFYQYDFRNDGDFLKCIEAKKENYLSHGLFSRDELTTILRGQNLTFDSQQKTFDNIELLNEGNTYAVVTGQQLGFLTGPYYTILKALNTIQLAEKLNKKFSGYNFVPVFWLEADDHDFLEINNVNVISKENEIKKISYFEKGEESEKYLKPAGNIILDDEIQKFIGTLEDSFNKTDFSDSLFNAIKNSYSKDTDVKIAFAKFINSLFGDKGLILIDPSDKEIKKLLKNVFKTELDTAPQTCEKVIHTSVELEKNYSVQVKPKAINLFYIHDGNRYLLEPRDNDIYALKHSRQKFSKEELYSLLESNPERFSWNVVTRPICEDYLLPTVAYIGGPSEVSYFGQFKEVYEFFNVTMPVIYPRTSVTIIESRVKTFLTKYDLKFSELLDEKNLSRKLLKNLSDVSADEIFSGLKEELSGLFYTYEKELARIDANQTESFSKRNKQFVESMDVAREKFVSLQSKQSEVITNQLAKILTNVYPDNNLQERVLNISYFINKYGMDFVDRLMQEINIDAFEHQLIDASPGSGQ